MVDQPRLHCFVTAHGRHLQTTSVIGTSRDKSSTPTYMPPVRPLTVWKQSWHWSCDAHRGTYASDRSFLMILCRVPLAHVALHTPHCGNTSAAMRRTMSHGMQPRNSVWLCRSAKTSSRVHTGTGRRLTSKESRGAISASAASRACFVPCMGGRMSLQKKFKIEKANRRRKCAVDNAV